LPNKINYRTIPNALLPLFRESYLARLSETFSSNSHEGLCDVALEAGVTLLAFYVLIYPVNYPQIGELVLCWLLYNVTLAERLLAGMHLLEMAKTAWNALVVNKDEDMEETFRRQAECFLASSHNILTVFGLEGDEGGPLTEIETLQNLLDEII
jgi:SET and MYND domain-containing protein